jgi:hypothetical protein
LNRTEEAVCSAIRNQFPTQRPVILLEVFHNPNAYARDLDAIEQRQWLQHKRWDELTIEEMRYHDHGLSILSLAAFQYFLPAYLLAEMVDPNEADFLLEGRIVPVFIPGHRSRLHAQERAACLTKGQLESIILFFECMRDRYGRDGGRLDTDLVSALEVLKTELTSRDNRGR